MKIKLLLLASLFLAACSSSDELNLSDSPLLRTVDYTDTSLNEGYIYGDNNLLDKTLINGSLNESFESENDKIVKKTKTSLSYTYEYDDNGRLKTRKDFLNDISLNRHIEYSYNGDLVTATLIDEEGIIADQKTEFVLDSNGRVLEKKTYATSGDSFELLFDETLTYNTNGNITQLSVENITTLLTTTTTYEYTAIKNPYYYAFKETYNSIYLDVLYSGYSVRDNMGISPFLIDQESVTYKTNNNFPVESVNSENNTVTEYRYY